MPETPNTTTDPHNHPPDEEWLHPDEPDAYPRVLRIIVNADDWHAEAIEQATADETVAVRRFPHPTDVRPVLTEQRVRLIKELQHEPAESIVALAERLGRNKRQVHDDLGVLEDFGLIHYRDGTGRAKSPFVPYEHVRVEVDISTDD